MQNAVFHISFVTNRLLLFRKTTSLSAYLLQILDSAQPRTNSIGRKKIVSAFQWYEGRGDSDRAYIGKSMYVYLNFFMDANASFAR